MLSDTCSAHMQLLVGHAGAEMDHQLHLHGAPLLNLLREFLRMLSGTTTSFFFPHASLYSDPRVSSFKLLSFFSSDILLSLLPSIFRSQFLSLWQPRLDTVSNLVRNVYEAYTLYSFGMFLIACMGEETRTVFSSGTSSRVFSSFRLNQSTSVVDLGGVDSQLSYLVFV